jgi:DNA-binding protein Fis
LTPFTIGIANGNQAKAARWLGVTRATMREKLVHFGLHVAGEMLEGAAS